MKKIIKARCRHILLLCSLFTLGIVFTLTVVSSQFRSAGSFEQDGITQIGGSAAKLKNYDIRTDKSAAETLSSFRADSGISDRALADRRQKALAAENELRRRVPTLKVEYSNELRAPEVIAPDVRQSKSFLAFATPATKRSEVLRHFVEANDSFFGFDDNQIQELRVVADYANPNVGLSFAHLEQFVGGIPVFNGEIKAGFTKNGEMFRVINNLAPGLDDASLSGGFGTAENAVRAAFNFVERETKPDDVRINTVRSNDSKFVFGEDDFGTTAEKIYFPIEPGAARAAWRILIWESVNAYYIIVDGETGALLWRKNITEDQTQPATYNVYANTTSTLKALDNPAPMTPGITNPFLQTQAPLVPRSNVTLVGNEAPNVFNNLGWIADGGNTTDGNNVEAGLDRVNPDGIDAGSRAIGNNRVFSFNYNPGDPNGAGEAPISVGSAVTPCAQTVSLPLSEYQKGVVTQLFYLSNRYHDELYKLGFTEAARNFQNDNFGRGGDGGGDRVSAEGQDCAGTNNANFGTPPDGARGRMQMYIFTAADPDRDGSLASDIIVHELTHGLSNRLIGNAGGLGSAMARGMGEGWSDFYAAALLSEPSDPVDGVYPSGAYTGYNPAAAVKHNYYYGSRRFPYAIMSATGGANNRPHNPLTFADIDGSQKNLSDGAFAPRFDNASDETHSAGEIWCMTLLEVRARFIRRLGYVEGNRRILQLVTDAMKVTPLNPTFLQARDAVVAVAQASGSASQDSADTQDVWAGFAVRGMGFSARVLSLGTGSSDGSTRVSESFDLPNVIQTPGFTFSVIAGNNNGYPEPGETIKLSVPLTNNTGATISGITMSVNDSAAVNFGTISNGTTIFRQIDYVLPATVPCGSDFTLTFHINSNLGSHRETRTIRVGTPIFNGGSSQNFDGASAPSLPNGWEKSQEGAYTSGWVTTASNVSGGSSNALFAPSVAGFGIADVAVLTRITSEAAQLRFKLNYNVEETWDGTVLEIKIGDAEYQDITVAGGEFISGAYNEAIDARAGHVLSGRKAWTGNSGGYLDAVINLPASANNQVVGLRFRTASDASTAAVGTFIDNVELTGGTFFSNYACGRVNSSNTARADFDGDGKTDRAVFRAGIWSVLRSQTGFVGQPWGLANDQIVSGDFDGDGRDDFAVYRAGATSFWYVINSGNGSISSIGFGTTGDIPVTGDFNGDGRDDIGVFRNGAWYIAPSGGGEMITYSFGLAGDKPVVADYDGDNKADVAVTRGGAWYVLASTVGFRAVQFGLTGDIAVPADYDGDGKDDIAVFRNGFWYVLRSSDNQFQSTQFGLAGDIPVPGDYDGDRKEDIAVYRGGNWYVLASSNGFNAVQFGLGGDTAVPSVLTNPM